MHIGENLAIIKGIGFGYRDCGKPTLWFDAMMDGYGVLLLFQGDAIIEFVKEWEVYDIRQLEGKAIVVEVAEGKSIKYLRKAII